jgi:hypothetical protein
LIYAGLVAGCIPPWSLLFGAISIFDIYHYWSFDSRDQHSPPSYTCRTMQILYPSKLSAQPSNAAGGRLVSLLPLPSELSLGLLSSVHGELVGPYRPPASTQREYFSSEPFVF